MHGSGPRLVKEHLLLSFRWWWHVLLRQCLPNAQGHAEIGSFNDFKERVTFRFLLLFSLAS